jgi:penicillin-binding protein 2
MSQYISNPEEARSYQTRYKILYIFIALTVVIFTFRLFWLQVILGSELRTFSEKNRVKQNKIISPRGLILDRNGSTLVENLPGFEAILSPQYIEDKRELAQVIGPIISMTEDKVVEKIDRSLKINGPFSTIRIKENLNREEVFRLKRLRIDLPGLEIRESIVRTYPLQENGAQLFGYVGEISKRELSQLKAKQAVADQIQFNQGDIIGKSGLEELLDDKIRGNDGVRFIQVDAHGRETITKIPNIYGKEITDLEPIHGNNATLTIDKDIQIAAYDSFVKNKRIGSLVAMKSNGEILSWINAPSFNPNDFATEIPARTWSQLITNPFKPLRNKAIQDHFPPGSTFKPFMALAALQAGVITDKTVIFAPGRFFFGNRWYHDHNKNGEGHITVYEALEKSSNVFFYQMGIKLGIDKMYNYISLLGLGSRTGIEMPREIPGLLPSAEWKKNNRGEEWQPGENLSTAIGQGYVSASLMQMAVAYNTIATDGKVVRPMIIKKVTDHEGKVLFEQFPSEVRDITQPQKNGYFIETKNFEIVKEAMRRVANGRSGTARHWKIPGVEMAGKTGTAQVQNFSADQIYQSCEARPIASRHHGWYIAWAPWDKPEIVVAVLAQHACHGNTAAAPIVRDVVTAYYKKYHPGYLEEAAKKPGEKPVAVPARIEGDND